MKFVNALAVPLGVIGALLTYLALSFGLFFIWAVFLATCMGVALGGGREAFKSLVICGSLGVVLASVASLIIVNVAVPLPGAMWPAIVVGATTACMALAANLPVFGAIPATVIGYASTFAYLLSANKLSNETFLTLDFGNPLVINILSIIVAAAFGMVSLNIAGKLAKPALA